MVQMQNRPLPRIPEAIIPGTPYGLEVLKIICVLFCLVLVASAFTGIHAFHWSTGIAPGSPSATNMAVARDNSFAGALWSAIRALFYAGVAYGIHKRALVAWKLGWIVIAGQLLYLPVWALSVTSKIPRSESPKVAVAAIVVGGTAIALYWGLWWNRQKAYFD
jgi:hypothetical protein